MPDALTEFIDSLRRRKRRLAQDAALTAKGDQDMPQLGQKLQREIVGILVGERVSPGAISRVRAAIAQDVSLRGAARDEGDDDMQLAKTLVGLLSCLRAQGGGALASALEDFLSKPPGAAAQDEPAPFKGRPEVGGTMTTTDAWLASRRGPPAQDAAAAKSFNERFPGAAKIRVEATPSWQRT